VIIVTARQIDILLSTYNGEDYIEEQLESIFAQDIHEWHILIRDDGSTDRSVSIIEEFASRYPDKITVIVEPSGRLDIPGAFECLLENSTSPYVAFCDQDDVWHLDKLRLLRERILQLEGDSEEKTPVLVHSDLRVVNDELVELADSFWKYQKLNPSKMQSLERLLLQNCVTGCATMVNRALVDRALPIPKVAIMHDWWFALFAASAGKIEGLSARTTEYRQHVNNNNGAKEWGSKHILYKLLTVSGWRENKFNLQHSLQQAMAMLEHDGIQDSPRCVIQRYVDLHKLNWFVRRVELMRNGHFKYGFFRNIGLFLLI
jgi:glycosyltransferase involved in cell wall biosynthesis